MQTLTEAPLQFSFMDALALLLCCCYRIQNSRVQCIKEKMIEISITCEREKSLIIYKRDRISRTSRTE